MAELVYLSVAEAAELLRCSRKAVYCLAERGKLPGLRRGPGGRLLIRRADLVRSIEESVSAPQPEKGEA